MAVLAPLLTGKLGRFIRLLGSDQDGEVVAAARALVRTLSSAGADLHALADHVEKTNDTKIPQEEMQRLYNAGFAEGYRVAEEHMHGNGDFRNVNGMPSWSEIARFCHHRDYRLSAREREFISSVSAHIEWREPSEKQGKWLRSIFLRLGGKLS